MARNRIGIGRWLVAAGACALMPVAADATLFKLDYTTFDDGIHAPVTVDATLDGNADPYNAGGYLLNGITGTRGGTAITGLSDPFSEVFVPAAVLPAYQFATHVDSFGFTFTAGGIDYQVYRGPSDASFYHEFENPNGVGTGRLIAPARFTLVAAAAVPEPGTWAMLLAGFGAVGAGLRRRRPVPA